MMRDLQFRYLDANGLESPRYIRAFPIRQYRFITPGEFLRFSAFMLFQCSTFAHGIFLERLIDRYLRI